MNQGVIIIIIIIISIFKEDNVFSIIASLPYGPPVNTDIDYHRTFSDFFIFNFFIFCKCCNVSCAIFVQVSVISRFTRIHPERPQMQIRCH